MAQNNVRTDQRGDQGQQQQDQNGRNSGQQGEGSGRSPQRRQDDADTRKSDKGRQMGA